MLEYCNNINKYYIVGGAKKHGAVVLAQKSVSSRRSAREASNKISKAAKTLRSNSWDGTLLPSPPSHCHGTRHAMQIFSKLPVYLTRSSRSRFWSWPNYIIVSILLYLFMFIVILFCFIFLFVLETKEKIKSYFWNIWFWAFLSKFCWKWIYLLLLFCFIVIIISQYYYYFSAWVQVTCLFILMMIYY